MKKVTELRSRNLRHDRNSELVRRMRNGEQLTSFNSQSSWYPPRPIIEKDGEALGRLYGRATLPANSKDANEPLQAVDADNGEVITLPVVN